MPRPSKETQDALNAIPGSHRAKCTALDFHWSWRGTIGRILKGSSISLENENEVRRRLGLAPILPPTIPVPACPDCGSVHHARCNGNGGTAVVLAPGQRVTHQGQQRKRKQYWRPCLSKELQAALGAWAGTEEIENALWRLVVEVDEENQQD